MDEDGYYHDTPYDEPEDEPEGSEVTTEYSEESDNSGVPYSAAREEQVMAKRGFSVLIHGYNKFCFNSKCFNS